MKVYFYMRVGTAEQLDEAPKKQKSVQKKQPRLKKEKKK